MLTHQVWYYWFAADSIGYSWGWLMSCQWWARSSPGRTHDPCHPVSIVRRPAVPSNRSQILHLLHFPRIVRAPTRTLDMFISKMSIAKMPFEPCRAHRTVSRIADPDGRDPFVIPRASPDLMSSRSLHNGNTLLSRVLCSLWNVVLRCRLSAVS